MVATIRLGHANDLVALARALGQSGLFANRLAWQRVGCGSLVTAWSGSDAVGVAYLRQEQAEEPEISEHLPGVPLLTDLQVVPALRNRGVGQMLVTAAEEVAADLGYDRLARTANPDVERLYRRLGYQRWRHGPVMTFEGRRGELRTVMIKTLDRRAQLPPRSAAASW